MNMFVGLVFLAAFCSRSGDAAQLLRGVPLENGVLVDVQVVPLPHKSSVKASDYVDVCSSVGGQPVCNGGQSCTLDKKCAPLLMEQHYCNEPMKGLARNLGFEDNKNPFFRDMCNYLEDEEYTNAYVGGACLGPEGYQTANDLERRNIQPYTICASPVQAEASVGFLSSHGPCEVEHDCVMSPRYPLEYPGSSCAFAVLHDGVVSAEQFATVNSLDALSINGKEYKGTKGPDAVPVLSGDLITWKSASTHKGPYSHAGWRLCLERSSSSGSSSAQVQNLTKLLENERQRRRQEEQQAQRSQAALQSQVNETQLNLQRSMVTVQQQQKQVQRLFRINKEIETTLQETRSNETMLNNSLNASRRREAEAVLNEMRMRHQLLVTQSEAVGLRGTNQELRQDLRNQTSQVANLTQAVANATAKEQASLAELQQSQEQMAQLRKDYRSEADASLAHVEAMNGELEETANDERRYQREAEEYRGNVTILTDRLNRTRSEAEKERSQALVIENSLHEKLNVSEHTAAAATSQLANSQTALRSTESQVTSLTQRNQELQQSVDDQRTEVQNLRHEVTNTTAELAARQEQVQQLHRDLHRYSNASATIRQDDDELREARQGEDRLRQKVNDLHNNMSSLKMRLDQAHENVEQEEHEVDTMTQEKADLKAHFAGAMAIEEENARNLTRAFDKEQKKNEYLQREKSLPAGTFERMLGVIAFLAALLVLAVCFRCASPIKSTKSRKEAMLDEPLLAAEAGEVRKKVEKFEPKVTVVDWKSSYGVPMKSIQVSAPGRHFRTSNRTIRGKVEENPNGITSGAKLTLTKEEDVPEEFTVTEGSFGPTEGFTWTRTFDFQDGYWEVQKKKDQEFDEHGVWQVDFKRVDTGRTWTVVPKYGMDMASDTEEECHMSNSRPRRRSSTTGSVTTQASSDVGRGVSARSITDRSTEESNNVDEMSRETTTLSPEIAVHADGLSRETTGQEDPMYSIPWDDENLLPKAPAVDVDPDESASVVNATSQSSSSSEESSAGDQMRIKMAKRREQVEERVIEV